MPDTNTNHNQNATSHFSETSLNYNSLVDTKNFSEDEFSDMDSLKIVNRSPMPHADMNLLQSAKRGTTNLHKPTTIFIGGSNNYEIKSNGSGSDTNSLVLDTRIPSVLIESPVSSQQKNVFEQNPKQLDDSTSGEPMRRTAVIEVRPTYVTTTLMSHADQSPKNSASNVIFRHAGKVENLTNSGSSTLLLKTLHENKISLDNVYESSHLLKNENVENMSRK